MAYTIYKNRLCRITVLLLAFALQFLTNGMRADIKRDVFLLKRIIGYTCFMIAVGMLFMMFIDQAVIAFLITLLLLIVGFQLFCG